LLSRIFIHTIFVLLISGVTSIASGADQGFNYQQRVGLVSALKGQHLFSIQNPSIPPDTRVKLCSIKSEIPIYGVVKEKYQRQENDQRPLVLNNLEDQSSVEMTTYRFESEYADMSSVQLEVGVVSKGMGKTESVDCKDLDGDGTPEYYSNCSSREGYHSIVRSGEGTSDNKRWHVYYYFGYEVEGNCDVNFLR